MQKTFVPSIICVDRPDNIFTINCFSVPGANEKHVVAPGHHLLQEQAHVVFLQLLVDLLLLSSQLLTWREALEE